MSIVLNKVSRTFTIKGIFTANVLSCYDGDTITVAFAFRQEDKETFRIRLVGYDSPEIRVRKVCPKTGEVLDEEKRKDIKRKGLEARDYLRSLIEGKTVQLVCDGFDHFGRVLGDVWINDLHINEHMVTAGHAVALSRGKCTFGANKPRQLLRRP